MKTNTFFLITYLPPQKVDEILDTKLEQINRFAFITHDKDIYLQDDIDKDSGEINHKCGDAKTTHTHIYLETKLPRNADEICRWFKGVDEKGNKINTLAQRVREKCNALRYLIHDTPSSKGKYQYPLDALQTYNIGLDESALNALDNESCDETYDIVQAILSGAPKLSLLKKYGKNYLYHYSAFKDFVNDIKHESAVDLFNTEQTNALNLQRVDDTLQFED